MAQSLTSLVSNRPWLFALGCLGLCGGLLFAAINSSPVQAQGRASATTGLVAVIDINEVARQLGEAERLQALLDAKQIELQERLALLQQGYAAQLDQKKAAFGQPPSPEQQRELEQLSASLNTQILQERNLSQNEYSRYEIELEKGYADRVRPYALRIAQAQGFSVVVNKQSVYAFDSAVDVTISVIDELKKIPEFAPATGTFPSARPRVGAAQPGGGQFNPNNNR